jgi:ribosomal protein S3AE
VAYTQIYEEDSEYSAERKLLPYIKAENRSKYEEVVKNLVNILKTLPPEQIDGELNYIVTKMLKEVYPLRYYHINKAIGVLECIKLEYYRRVAAPYEDSKIKDSGDV